MNAKLNWQAKLRTIGLIAVIASAAYLMSFYWIRRDLTVTFRVRERLYSVEVLYFSHHAGLNRGLYALYWPLHRQRSDEWLVFEKALFERDQDEELARRKLRRFYVADVEVCRRAGLAGFRHK